MLSTNVDNAFCSGGGMKKLLPTKDTPVPTGTEAASMTTFTLL